jgi:hypothetical protein
MHWVRSIASHAAGRAGAAYRCARIATARTAEWRANAATSCSLPRLRGRERVMCPAAERYLIFAPPPPNPPRDGIA